MPKPLSSRQVQWLAILAAALMLCGLVAVVAWPVRGELRDQVIQHEADAIAAVAQLQRELGVLRLRQLGIEPTADDIFEALLESSQLEGVVAIQSYTADGRAARELPLEAFVEELAVADRVAATVGRLHPAAEESPSGAGLALGLAPGPWMEVIVPLPLATGEAPGWARFWLDGRHLAGELAAVDRQWWWVTGGAGAVGALLLAAVLAWAFAQLRRQSDDLARTNRELLLHTKTAAIGAISSHLFHGLKNPLAGLAGFMDDAPTGQPGTAWEEAAATTRRLRAMVNDVLGVLQDEQDGADYTVPVAEVLEAARQRVQGAVDEAGLSMALSIPDDGEGPAIDGRSAALAGLILGNLLDNAVAATPRGGQLMLRTQVEGGAVSIDVQDTGGGLPEPVRVAAFAPVRSTKPGGAGVGLSLSRQLARHAGGTLELVRSDAGGTCFRLTLPLSTKEGRQ